MVNGLRREEDDDDSEEVLSEKEGRKEGKMSGKQTEETDVPTNKWSSVLSFVCFWGLIHASTFNSTESQARISLYFST